MTCKKCGVVYEGDHCPNGCDQASAAKKEKKPIFKQWWFWLIVVIIGIAAISSTGDSDTDTPAGTTPPAVSTTDPAAQTEATVEESTAAQDPYYHVGDVIEANGLAITIVSAEKWESSNQFLQPEEGYQYIRLSISAENTSSSDRYISSFEFTCYADGKKEDTYVMGDEILDGGNLSSGRKTEGYLYFAVPVDAQSIEVEYETSFWTDKKAIIKVELP